MSDLAMAIEGVLFYKATPMKYSTLSTHLGVGEEAIIVACEELREALTTRGIRLVNTDSEVVLTTAPELDTLIESLRRDEMKRDIGKAGAETLAIILYRGPITRAEIDRIRGVNSSFIVRNLLIRGLIVRDQKGKGLAFTITPALLAHLGITKTADLPNHSQVLETLEAFEKQQAEAEGSI